MNPLVLVLLLVIGRFQPSTSLSSRRSNESAVVDFRRRAR